MTSLPGAYWAADASIALDDRPIGNILRERATVSPDLPALRCHAGDEIVTTSYATLLLHTTAAAQRLLAVAGERGRVAIIATGSRDWVVIEYAAALAGLALVPIDPAATDEEVELILSTVKVGLVLCDEVYERSPLLERVRALVKDQRFRRAPIVHPLAHWSDLAGEGTDLPSVDASDPFLLQPTSALTRLRGAIVISQRAAYNAGRLQMRHLDAGADDCWLNVAWLHDVGGSIGGVLATLSTGGVLALSADTGAGAIGRTIERTQATFVGRASSDVLARLGERAGRGRTDIARVRAVIATAAVLSSALLRRVEDRLGVVVKVYEHPGAPSALMTAPSDDSITKCETIGRPLPLHDVRIGRASGGTADCDEDGELLIRSLMTMDDYLGDAGGQGPAIDPEGWLHTGDLASMDERGVVRLRGAGRLS